MTDASLHEDMELLAMLMRTLEDEKHIFETRNKKLTDQIKNLQDKVKAEVLERGETVKGDQITVIWNKGKATWDGKLLEGYAVAHPEILAAKKTGSPTVSFKLNRQER